MSDIQRREFHVKSKDGYNIAVREVKAANAKQGTPIIYLHGTRIPTNSEFDLLVPGGSVAADLALAGHAGYLVDARGYGKSDRPAAMERPPGGVPFSRSMEIVRDLEAAAEAVYAATGQRKAAFCGWGVGATICLMYAALWPEKTSHVIMYDLLYGGSPVHPRLASLGFDDPDKPGHFNFKKYKNYDFHRVDMLKGMWDNHIPVADKDSWRDAAVQQAFLQALIDGDPTSTSRDPITYRAPNGMVEDSYYMGLHGNKLLHANQVYCKVMVIQPELDYFSRPADARALEEDLIHAEEVQVWQPKNATHYLLLERPERGRDEALTRIKSFLA
jgi:pimeloyl-ACP methyl ester carboxylesterase